MIRQFLDYLKLERNCSPRTVESYGKDLAGFEAYFKSLDNHLSWQSVDADIVRRWMESMMDKGNTASSINRRLSALRSFFRFALRRHLVETNPAHFVTGPKKEKPLPVFVKEREMDELLDSETWSSEYGDILARTILMVFYETGVRLAELIGLNDCDVDFVNNELKVTGKRDKQRIIPFGDELAKTLREYMSARDMRVEKKSQALLLSRRGGRISRSAVAKMVKENLAKVSTLKKRSPHVLRHTFATAMVNHEAGLESVRKLLGHDSLSTTEVYTHTTFEQLKRVYKSAHPRA